MISRRNLALGLIGYHRLLVQLAEGQAAGQEPATFDQLVYPPIEALDNPQPFGYEPATEAQKKKARDIADSTPKGPRPIDIAQSFVQRFSVKDPDAISQWPAPASWNPLIVEFFSVTSIRAKNDMIAWCAAFANWCIERSGHNGSRSASSQSFLSRFFQPTNDPTAGDLAIFTCYDKETGKSLGIGHVGFFKERRTNDTITVVGGNQSGDGHFSIISEKQLSTKDVSARRHVSNKYVPCTMRLNTFIKIE